MAHEDIFNVDYWKGRLDLVHRHNSPLHHSIFRCATDRWEAIERKHREILAHYIQPTMSILDAGCGYGRLLTLLPGTWNGWYWGLDISPDFIKMAIDLHPTYSFQCRDLREGFTCDKIFDVGILISMRPMIRRNMGDEVWAQIQDNLYKVCSSLLYLEYDESDPGSLETKEMVHEV